MDLLFLLVGSPLPRDPGFYITCLECSPVLGGYATVFSDGRGGFLSSQTAEAKPSVCIVFFFYRMVKALGLEFDDPEFNANLRLSVVKISNHN